MKIELLATGDELINGSLTDTNSSELAAKLTSMGHEVRRVTLIGDDTNDITSALLESAVRADAVICAGGLGPTGDDLTGEAAARAAGVELVFHEKAWEAIEARFEKINLPLAPTNKKQAMLPAGSEMMDNPIGTAPGFLLYIKGTPFFFAPGVPRELFRMFDEQILPRLARLDSSSSVYVTRTWRTFGYTESGLGDILAGVTGDDERLRLSFRATFPEIRITLAARAADREEAERLMKEPSKEIDEKIDRWCFSRDGKSLPEVVGDMLKEKGLKLVLAESCTGGLIGKMLTDVSGSSEYFEGAVVAYSNRLKMSILGVPRSVLDEDGAVSPRCAAAMAEGARKITGADIGLSVTGIAGPAGGTADRPVGTVYFGCSTGQGTETRGGQWPGGDREQVRLLSAYAALDFVRKTLLNT